MVIEEGFGNDYFNNLVIQNYPNLQSIVIKKNSLKFFNSLNICNCKKLEIIEIEDGGLNNGSFSFVNNVIIESTSELIFIILSS